MILSMQGKKVKSAKRPMRDRMVQRIDEIEWCSLDDIPRRLKFPFPVKVVGWILTGAAHYRGRQIEVVNPNQVANMRQQRTVRMKNATRALIAAASGAALSTNAGTVAYWPLFFGAACCLF